MRILLALVMVVGFVEAASAQFLWMYGTETSPYITYFDDLDPYCDGGKINKVEVTGRVDFYHSLGINGEVQPTINIGLGCFLQRHEKTLVTGTDPDTGLPYQFFAWRRAQKDSTNLAAVGEVVAERLSIEGWEPELPCLVSMGVEKTQYGIQNNTFASEILIERWYILDRCGEDLVWDEMLFDAPDVDDF